MLRTNGLLVDVFPCIGVDIGKLVGSDTDYGTIPVMELLQAVVEMTRLDCEGVR